MTHETCSIRELVGAVATCPTHHLAADLTDSDTGEVLHSQVESSSDAVEAALARARQVHSEGEWTGLSTSERAVAVRRFAEELAARVGALAAADSLDTGVPLKWTTMLIQGRVAMLETAAQQLQDRFELTEHDSSVGTAHQWRLPWGPAAVLLPWNAPTSTVITKISYALVAGCPVIVKFSEWAPHSSGPLSEAVLASLPPGLVQLVHGGQAVGEAVVADPRIRAVSYTGGVVGGTAVARTCASQLKPADLELSGNNPVLALPDADPGAVAGEVAFGMQLLNGQLCIAPRRLVVPTDRLEEYLEALTASLAEATIGPTEDDSATMGPLANAPHLAHLQAQTTAFEARGCEVRRHGLLPETGGHFLQPTVILGDPAPDLTNEIFGPIVVVRTYGDLDDAIAIANDHDFGLAGYVFGADREEALRVGSKLRAGLVTVNAVFGGGSDAPVLGSMWGSSGLGHVGGDQGPGFFSGYRFVG